MMHARPRPRAGLLLLAFVLQATWFAPGCAFTPKTASQPDVATPAQGSPRLQVRQVMFPSGDLALQGLIVSPDGDGPFPAILWNHGSEKYPGVYFAALAQPLVSAGYVVFMPLRRGQGTSPGPYINSQVALPAGSLVKARQGGCASPACSPSNPMVSKVQSGRGVLNVVSNGTPSCRADAVPHTASVRRGGAPTLSQAILAASLPWPGARRPLATAVAASGSVPTGSNSVVRARALPGRRDPLEYALRSSLE
jgi:hypothetical protein